MRCPAFIVSIILLLSQLTSAQSTQPTQPTLLVLNKIDSELCFVDPDEMKVIAKVSTGVGPHEVCVTDDGKLAIVANYGTAQVVGQSFTIVDLESRKALRTVDTLPLKRPHGLYADGKGKIWFSAETNACVGRFDPATDKIDAILGTGQGVSHMVVFNPKTAKLYTTNIMSDSVTVLTAKGPNPMPVHIPVNKQPEALAISPDGASVWVGHKQTGDIVVIDTKTNKVMQTIACGGVPIRLAFTPDGKRAIATAAEAGAVVVFDTATFKELARIEVGEVPIGIQPTPDSKRAFISCTGDGKVVCIDMESLKVTGSVQTGNQPDGMAWVGK